MAIIHDYLRMKAQEKLDLEMKESDYRNRSFKELNKKTTTNREVIPNMVDAYSKVRNSGQKPTPKNMSKEQAPRENG